MRRELKRLEQLAGDRPRPEDFLDSLPAIADDLQLPIEFIREITERAIRERAREDGPNA